MKYVLLSVMLGLFLVDAAEARRWFWRARRAPTPTRCTSGSCPTPPAKQRPPGSPPIDWDWNTPPLAPAPLRQGGPGYESGTLRGREPIMVGPWRAFRMM